MSGQGQYPKAVLWGQSTHWHLLRSRSESLTRCGRVVFGIPARLDYVTGVSSVCRNCERSYRRAKAEYEAKQL